MLAVLHESHLSLSGMQASESYRGKAVSARHVLPVTFSVVLPEQLTRFFAEVFRMRRKPFKKTSRVWFVPVKVEGLQDQLLAPFRRAQPEYRADYAAVTVAPENRAFDSYCIKRSDHLLRGPLVKIRRHLAGHARRAPVPRSVPD